MEVRGSRVGGVELACSFVLFRREPVQACRKMSTRSEEASSSKSDRMSLDWPSPVAELQCLSRPAHRFLNACC